MEISIYSLLEGAARASGAVAVIDLFRAFTTAAVALVNGGIPRRDGWRGRGRAGTMRRRDRTDLYGEVGGRTPDGFDFGNSPYEISGVDFRGQTIIQRTSARTRGIVEAAGKAKWLYAASLELMSREMRQFIKADQRNLRTLPVINRGFELQGDVIKRTREKGADSRLCRDSFIW